MPLLNIHQSTSYLHPSPLFRSSPYPFVCFLPFLLPSFLSPLFLSPAFLLSCYSSFASFLSLEVELYKMELTIHWPRYSQKWLHWLEPEHHLLFLHCCFHLLGTKKNHHDLFALCLRYLDFILQGHLVCLCQVSHPPSEVLCISHWFDPSSIRTQKNKQAFHAFLHKSCLNHRIGQK